MLQETKPFKIRNNIGIPKDTQYPKSRKTHDKIKIIMVNRMATFIGSNLTARIKYKTNHTNI